MIVKLCNAADLPEEGTLKAFRNGRFDICIARCGGRTYAFENKCPHQNAPLSAGDLDGCTVICPYHAWRFHVGTGQSEMAGDPPLKLYEVRQYLDKILIRLPG